MLSFSGCCVDAQADYRLRQATGVKGSDSMDGVVPGSIVRRILYVFSVELTRCMYVLTDQNVWCK